MNFFEKIKNFMRQPTTNIILSVVATVASLTAVLRPAAAAAATPPANSSKAPVTLANHAQNNTIATGRAADLLGTPSIGLNAPQVNSASTASPLQIKQEVKIDGVTFTLPGRGDPGKRVCTQTREVAWNGQTLGQDVRRAVTMPVTLGIRTETKRIPTQPREMPDNTWEEVPRPLVNVQISGSNKQTIRSFEPGATLDENMPEKCREFIQNAAQTNPEVRDNILLKYQLEEIQRQQEATSPQASQAALIQALKSNRQR